MTKMLLRAALCVSLMATVSTAQADTIDLTGRIVWNDINNSQFLSANFDGSDVQTLFTASVTTAGFDIDRVNDKFYWQSVDGVFRADFDGSNFEQIITPTDTNTSLPAVGGSTANVLGLEVDPVAGFVYWIDQDDNIRRADLDGSNPTTLFSVTRPPEFGVSGAGSADLALDTVNGYLFVSTQNSGTIVRANLNGGGRQEIVTGLTNPQGLFIDSAADRIYVTQLSGEVAYTDLNGNGLTTIISSGSGLQSPGGLAYSAATDRFFTTFRSATDEKIQSFRSNGSNLTDLVTVAGLFPQYYDIQLGIDDAGGPEVPAATGLGTALLLGFGAFRAARRRVTG